MKYALISPNEKAIYVSSFDGKSPVLTEVGARVVDVSATPFDVSEPLFWVECSDDVVPDRYGYSNGDLIAVPADAQAQNSVVSEQPTITGAQTL